MSKISGKETKPEIKVRKYLFANGFRYRKNVKTLAGKPDIVLPRYKTVIFIHGCFWHLHDCKRGNDAPKTNAEFWQNKRVRTAERDKQNIQILESQNWKVLVIWECETNNTDQFAEKIAKILPTTYHS